MKFSLGKALDVAAVAAVAVGVFGAGLVTGSERARNAPAPATTTAPAPVTVMVPVPANDCPPPEPGSGKYCTPGGTRTPTPLEPTPHGP